MARVHATSVGCKVSRADSRAALRALADAGHTPVERAADADLYVVMTCAVTSEAERKSRQLVRRLAAAGRPVVVAGCASALRGAQFDGEVVSVLPADDAQTALAGVVEAAARAWAAVDGGGVEAGRGARHARPAPPPLARTRITLKVQDGCPAACTFCVVRLVRGTPWSLPARAAAAQAAAALAGGCGELVLSGVNLGRYRDRDEGIGLAGLVERLLQTPGLARLRLSSIEPCDVTPRLLGALADERVARHLHVPLQSGDDRVLGAMGRPYSFADYRALMERARERVTDLALTTDVIVGFPTEDEAAFARTLAAIAPPDGLFGRVHVFGYSRRPGTAAAGLGTLPAAVVKERVGRALAAAAAARTAAACSWLSRAAEVLVEEYRDGLWRGYSSQYVRYYLSGEAERGCLLRAVGLEPYRDGLKGRLA
jgi:threonylcarbamoyladenosine tRNA methylthiotransferase MtaB